MSPRVAFGSARGWYLIWPNGFESAMPDKETAYKCAAADVLVTALQDVVDNVRDDSPEMWGHVEAAIEKAKGPQ